MVKIERCPICDNNEFATFINCQDHLLTKESFSLIQCSECKFIITSPRPENDALGKYYKSSDYISHSDTSTGYLNKLYRFIRNITLKQKLKLIRKYHLNPKLLDIGSGAGYFLDYCNRNGISSVGIEPDNATRLNSINQFGIKVYSDHEINTLGTDSFDVITLWHVLEHIPNLNEQLFQIQSLLRSNGTLIVAVPNSSSPDAHYYKEMWAGFDVPRHLWHFQPETLNQLILKYNFKLESIKPMIFDSFYVSMLSEKYRKSKISIFTGFFVGLISNMIALCSSKKRYSSQIYIFKKIRTT